MIVDLITGTEFDLDSCSLPPKILNRLSHIVFMYITLGYVLNSSQYQTPMNIGSLTGFHGRIVVGDSAWDTQHRWAELTTAALAQW